MNQKQKEKLRNEVYEVLLTNAELFNASLVGRDKEGVVFEVEGEENTYFVIRTIVKSEEFDGYVSVEEYEKNQQKKAEKAKKAEK